MCDFSLHHVKSRPARVGDKLTTINFNTWRAGGSHDGGVPSSWNRTCFLRGDKMRPVGLLPLEDENDKFQNGDLSANQQGRATGTSRRTRISRWHVRSPDKLG
jgi:hypothetical protein